MNYLEYPAKTVSIKDQPFTATFYDPTSEMLEFYIDGKTVMVPSGPCIRLQGTMKINGINILVDERFRHRNGRFERAFQLSYSKREDDNGALTSKINSWLSIDLAKIAEHLLSDDMVREAHRTKLYNDYVKLMNEATKLINAADSMKEKAVKAFSIYETELHKQLKEERS